MIEKYYFLLLTLEFTLIPLALFVVIDHKMILKNLRVVAVCALISFVSVLVSIIVSPSSIPWHFAEGKNLGMVVLGFPVEIFILASLFGIAVSSGVLVFMSMMRKKA